jgi:hypothetical protein
MTPRNIISGWSETDLRPLNPDRMLREIQKPQIVKHCSPLDVEFQKDDLLPLVHQLETPKTSTSLASLRKDIEMSIAQGEALDAHTKLSVQKVANAAENAFADRAILLDESLLLFEQNKEKTTRTSIKATVVGTAKALSYENIVEAQQKRNMKEAEVVIVRGRRTLKRNRSTPSQVIGKMSRSYEREEPIDEIRASGLEKYCSVLSF